MNNQNLIIYDSKELFEILNEVKEIFNFNLKNISKKEFSSNSSNIIKNSIILTLTKINTDQKQIFLNKLPIKIPDLVERINVEFLRQKFNDQSNEEIGSYKININSRIMLKNNIKLKLTEKEINTILYLSKLNKPVKIEELQVEVWGHHSKLETHTVETHIHRLRKKISKVFNDDNFILSKKNGYQIY